MPIFTLTIQVTCPPGTQAKDLPVSALGADAKLVGYSTHVAPGEPQVVLAQGMESSKMGNLGGS